MAGQSHTNLYCTLYIYAINVHKNCNIINKGSNLLLTIEIFLTLVLGRNIATSSAKAFQHDSSNNIHCCDENFTVCGLRYVNRMQKLLRNPAYFLL